MTRSRLFQLAMDAVRAGRVVGWNTKESGGGISLRDGVWTLQIGWPGGETRFEHTDPDVFHAHLTEKHQLPELGPSIAGYLGQRGLEALERADWKAAAHHFDEAIQGGFSFVYTGRALLCAVRGQHAEGQAVLAQMATIVAEAPHRYSGCGLIEQFFSRVKGAGSPDHAAMIRYQTLLLSLDPALPEGLFLRGNAHDLSGNTAAARRDLEHALPLLDGAHQSYRRMRVQDMLARIKTGAPRR